MELYLVKDGTLLRAIPNAGHRSRLFSGRGDVGFCKSPGYTALANHRRGISADPGEWLIAILLQQPGFFSQRHCTAGGFKDGSFRVWRARDGKLLPAIGPMESYEFMA